MLRAFLLLKTCRCYITVLRYTLHGLLFLGKYVFTMTMMVTKTN